MQTNHQPATNLQKPVTVMIQLAASAAVVAAGVQPSYNTFPEDLQHYQTVYAPFLPTTTATDLDLFLPVSVSGRRVP